MKKVFDEFYEDSKHEQSMINYIDKNHPNVNTKCGNAKESITYEKGSFSHILATGMCIYLFENKDEFLRNCFYWLKPGGYLILHLVDREKFDTIVPRGKPGLLKHPQKYASSRITSTNIDFIDFKYNGKYDFSQIILEYIDRNEFRSIHNKARSLAIAELEKIT